MKKLLLTFIITITGLTHSVWGQQVSTTSPFNYGTGLIASNTAPFSTVGGTNITVSGNDITVTGNVTMAAGTYNFRNFTVNAGAVVTLSGTTPVIIRCTGTCTINGTITGAGGAGGNNAAVAAGGAGGAGGGGGGRAGGAGGTGSTALAGGTGTIGTSFPGTTGRGTPGNNGNSNAGGNGGCGGSYFAVGGNGGGTTNTGLAYGDANLTTVLNSTNLLGGSGGGGGGANNGTAGQRRGGTGGGGGGGAFSITASDIVIGANGLLSVKGGKAGDATGNTSGGVTPIFSGSGGGGSGGTILLQYLNTLTGTTTLNTTQATTATSGIDISGGNRGTGAFTGGLGSQGRYLAQLDNCTPSVQASGFSSSVVDGNTLSVGFTRGNGTGGVLVVARLTSTTAVPPTQGTSSSTYTANTTFGSGSTTGTGNFVVYNGIGNGTNTAITNFNVGGLTTGVSYTFDVYEYSSGNCYNLVALSGSNTPSACTPPATAPTSLSFTSVTNAAITVNWTNATTGNAVLVVVKSSAMTAGETPIIGTSYTTQSAGSIAFTAGQALGGGYIAYNAAAAPSSAGSVTITGLASNTTYFVSIYSYDNATACYNVSNLSGSQLTLNPMTYTSSNAVQQTGNITPGATNQQILRLDVVAGTGTNPVLTVNSITFNTNGSTSTADITNAKIYYTGTSSTFATTTQFGTTVSSFPGGSTPIVVSGTQNLSAGTNYFWIAYDIPSTATVGNVVDAEWTSINLGSTSVPAANYTPTTTAPAGNRTIQPTYCTFANGGISACYLGINNYGLTSFNLNSTVMYTNASCTDVASVDNYSSTNTTFTMGQTGIPISLSRFGNSYLTYFFCYADWNNDGDFVDSGELFYSVSLPASGTNSNSGTFNVPISGSGIVAGVHRIRIVSTYTNNPAAAMCSSSQATSYDFKVTVLQSCTQPSTQATVGTTSPLNSTDATLNWTRGNGTAGILVVARLNSTTAVPPTSGTTYTTNTSFGSGTGSAITGAGNFVVYNGPATSVTITNLLPLTQYAFDLYEYNTASVCYKTPAASGTFTTPDGNQIYISSTTAQSSTAAVFQSQGNVQIIGLTVNTIGNVNPFAVSAINLSTSGSTNASDISAARVFFTGSSAVFNANTQYGSTVTNPSGSFTVNGSANLVSGTNYFWVVYDISPSGVIGNVVDATCAQFTMGSTVTPSANYVPAVTAPTGSRTIAAPTYANGVYGIPILYYDFEDNNNRNTLANFSVGAETAVNSATGFGNVGFNFAGQAGPATILGGTNGAGTALVGPPPATSSSTPTLAPLNYMQVSLNTQGFQGLSIAFNMYCNGTSIDWSWVGVNYSIDGTNWVQLATYPTNFQTWYTLRAQLPAACENQANVRIRFYGYYASLSTSTIVIDNFTLLATSTTTTAGTKNLIDPTVVFQGNVSSPTNQGILYLYDMFTATGAGTIVNQPTNYGLTVGLNVTNGATYNFGTGASPSYLLAQSAAFTLGSGATLGITDNGGIKASTPFGNVQSYGVRSYSTSANYNYIGATVQNTGDGLPATVNNLTINNTAGVILDNTSVTVNGTLALTNGIFSTNGPTNFVILGSTGTTTRTNGWVLGNLTKPVIAGNPTVTYEVGNLNNYTPATYAFSGVSTPGTFNTRVVTGAHPNFGTACLNNSKYVNQYWKNTNTGTSPLNYQATLNYTAAELVGSPTPANFVMGNYTTSWAYPTVAGTPTATAITATGLTAAGELAVAEGSFVTPSVTIAANPTGTQCLGTSITFTATPTNGGTTPTYNFMVNGNSVQSGTANTYTTTTLANNDVVTVELTSNAGCTTTATATPTSPITVSLTPCGPLVWNGSVSTNWNDPQNWTPNTVPTAGNDIQIPNVANDPDLTTGANGACKAVTISAGATLSIASGKTIDVKGSWSGANNVISGAGRLIFSGTTAQTISGGATISNWQINNSNGVTVAAGPNTVRVTSAVELKSGTLTTNSNFITNSTAAATAYIDDFSSGFTGSISGTVRVQRFINAGASGFRYIGTPVNTSAGVMALSGLSGFTAAGTPGQIIPLPTCDPNNVAINSPYGNFMYWSENGPFPVAGCKQSGWYFQTTGTMIVAKGYGAKLSPGNTLTYTGNVNTGNINGGTLSNTTAEGNGWHLVSNPYPSAMAISNIDGNANNNMPAGFDGQIQFFQASGAYTGTYQAYNVGVQTAPIALGQGFWVRTASSGNWSLTNNYRTTNNPTYYNEQSPVAHHLNINVSGNGFMDQTDINFVAAAAHGIDFYDANKWTSSNGVPTLFSLSGNEMLAINSVPSLTETVAIPVGFKPGANGEFTFSFNDLATFPASALVYLEDTKTGSMVNLRNANNYTFTATLNDEENRFILHFNPGVVANVTDNSCEQSGSISYTQPGNTTWDSYDVKDNNGIVYAQGTNFSGTLTLTNLQPQEYILTLNHASGYTAQLFTTVNGNGISGVSAVANASADNVMVNEVVDFSATANNATQYTWNFGDGNTATGLSASHSFVEEGIYTVSLTAANENCEATATKTITVNRATSINLTDADGLTVYGNGNRVVVEFNQWGGDKADIFMYNALGQRVESLTGVSTLKGRTEVQIENLKPGYYFVQIASNGKVAGKKLLLGY